VTAPHLRLMKHRLPPLWDGYRVRWDAFAPMGAMHICPPPDIDACESCGSIADRLIATGLRHPLPSETLESTRTKTGRFGRPVRVPTTIPAYPLRDLYAFRCPDCLGDDVWDQRTDEWWSLGPEDYTDAGSVRPDEI
jgi:hypothetical protein